MTETRPTDEATALDLDAVGWTLYVANQEIEGIPFTAPEVIVGRAREAIPLAAALADEVRRLRAERDAAVARAEQAEAELAAALARIGSAMTWIDRHEQKNGGLMIVLDNIKDSLTGIACVDATPGSTDSSRFAAGLAATSALADPAPSNAGEATP